MSTGLGPLKSWLRDYGSFAANPLGALFYNLGCVVSAVMLGAFYAGISQWYRRRSAAKKYVVCYICAQASAPGVFNTPFIFSMNRSRWGIIFWEGDDYGFLL
ncbi:MAG: hypothetical protein ACOX8Q_04425 [Christensenellales bacterium]|jgi:hypothetical protein